ncbi:protein-primed DNA polymerase B [Archaeal virus sp.]|nr:protein-primed DNA polymerase B [Archaeal virus sp.]
MKTVQLSSGKRDFIRPLKRAVKVYGEKYFMVLDVETKVEADGTHKFLFAYVLEYHPSRRKFKDLKEKIEKCSRLHFFRNQERLTHFLFNPNRWTKKTRIIFGHNITYDLKFLKFDIPKKLGFKLKRFMLNPTFITFVNKKMDFRVTFLDTFNFYKTSLEKLFPDEKVAIDFKEYDYSNLNLLKKRCKIDVLLTARLVHDLKGISASDMSFKVFRTKNVYIQKIETPLAKESYYGGRVECFINSLRVENVKYYDFNSLYPSVMKNNLFPIKFIQTLDNPTVETVKELIKRKFFLFAQVEVEVPEDVRIPPFPFRGEDSKLYFPVGKFTTFLASPEIELGLELGYIKRFIKVEEYYSKEIFTEFVEEYYKLRQEHPELKEYYKLILNSLYGKFGQREHQTKLVETEDSDFIGKVEFEGKEIYYIFNGYGFKTTVTEKRKYNVAIASAVTSYARVKLYRLMQSINFDVVYCDTDSIFTVRKLETSKELGGLKLECEGTFLGFRAKCYVIGDKVKFKGGKVSLQLLNNCGEEITVEMEKFPTFREFIKNKGIVKNLKVIKKFNLVDDKRKGRGLTEPYNAKELMQKWEK